jgi:hypothetical protein
VQGVERCLAAATDRPCDERLDLGAVAEKLGARIERHVRLARIAVAQDAEAASRHRLRQCLVATDSRSGDHL